MTAFGPDTLARSDRRLLGCAVPSLTTRRWPPNVRRLRLDTIHDVLMRSAGLHVGEADSSWPSAGGLHGIAHGRARRHTHGRKLARSPVGLLDLVHPPAVGGVENVPWAARDGPAPSTRPGRHVSRRCLSPRPPRVPRPKRARPGQRKRAMTGHNTHAKIPRRRGVGTAETGGLRWPVSGLAVPQAPEAPSTTTAGRSKPPPKGSTFAYVFELPEPTSFSKPQALRRSNSRGSGSMDAESRCVASTPLGAP
jgi:hypothetical protein